MSEPVTEVRKTDLLEDLAALEHEQWRKWAYELIDTEQLSRSRVDRWLKILQLSGYQNLPEEMKERDREWAERVLWIVKKHLGIR